MLILDIWSTGCVMAELLTGSPLFPGESGIDQLVEIIKVLGTPSKEQIRTMNPNYMEHKFPQIKPHPFNRVNSRQEKHFDIRFSVGKLAMKSSISSRIYCNIPQQHVSPPSTLSPTNSSKNFEIHQRDYPTREV